MIDPETTDLTPANSAEPDPAPQPAIVPAAAAGGLALVWEVAQVVLLALLMVMLILENFGQNFRIDGISMEPNFHNGQFLIVNRFAYCPGIDVEVPIVNVKLWEKTWCVREPEPRRCGDIRISTGHIPGLHQASRRAAGRDGRSHRRQSVCRRPVDAGAVRPESGQL